MGWEFWQADLAKSRRQLVIEHVEWDHCEKSCRVIYARERGREVYLAVKVTDSKTNYENVFGVVALTQLRSKESLNFGAKIMDETMHPVYYHAPKKLLELLSPTSDEEALSWRNGCWKQYRMDRQYNNVYNQLSALPYGTIIRLNNPNKTLVELYYHRGKLFYKIVGKKKLVKFGVVASYGYEIVSVGRTKMVPA